MNLSDFCLPEIYRQRLNCIEYFFIVSVEEDEGRILI